MFCVGIKSIMNRPAVIKGYNAVGEKRNNTSTRLFIK